MPTKKKYGDVKLKENDA